MWKVTVKWDVIPNQYNYLAKSHNGWFMFRQKPQFIQGVCDLPEQWLTCGEGEGARLDYPEDFLSVRNENSNHRATGSLERNSLQTRPIADAQPKSGLVINWESAPFWANYAARNSLDCGGKVILFANLPKPNTHTGAWLSTTGSFAQAPEGCIERVDLGTCWDRSIVGRFSKQKEEVDSTMNEAMKKEAKVDKRTAFDKQADDLLARSKKERTHAKQLAASAKFLKSKEFKAIVAEAERCGLRLVVAGHCS